MVEEQLKFYDVWGSDMKKAANVGGLVVRVR